MEGKSTKSIIIMGKMKDVFEYLKECENNYIYVKDLIDDMNRKKSSGFIN